MPSPLFVGPGNEAITWHAHSAKEAYRYCIVILQCMLITLTCYGAEGLHFSALILSFVEGLSLPGGCETIGRIKQHAAT